MVAPTTWKPVLPRSKRRVDTARPVFVTRPLKLGDYVYAVGEVLPWRELEIDEKMLQMWFQVGHVSNENPVVPDISDPAPPSAAPSQTAATAAEAPATQKRRRG